MSAEWRCGEEVHFTEVPRRLMTHGFPQRLDAADANDAVAEAAEASASDVNTTEWDTARSSPDRSWDIESVRYL
jgi:hypothetical protein